MNEPNLLLEAKIKKTQSKGLDINDRIRRAILSGRIPDIL
jgi:hypothetical protein